MSALTQQQYVEHAGCLCPACGAAAACMESLRPQVFGTTDNGYWMHCDVCGAQWRAVYTLTRFTDLRDRCGYDLPEQGAA
jgi:formate dehydrogenase maturation protein FdhE